MRFTLGDAILFEFDTREGFVMASGNRVLKLLESGEATIEDVVQALHTFERELATGRDVGTSTCQFCGTTYVVSQDKTVVAEQGRRSVCWRRACRQELRARGLQWAGHHLYQRRSPFEGPRPAR